MTPEDRIRLLLEAYSVVLQRPGGASNRFLDYVEVELETAFDAIPITEATEEEPEQTVEPEPEAEPETTEE